MRGEGERHLQALVSNAGFGTPDAVDAMATKHADQISTSWRGSSEAVFALVPLWDSVCEGISFTGFNLTRIFQHQSIRAVLVECGATFNSLQADDACMMCEERVDPPTGA